MNKFVNTNHTVTQRYCNTSTPQLNSSTTTDHSSTTEQQLSSVQLTPNSSLVHEAVTCHRNSQLKRTIIRPRHR